MRDHVLLFVNGKPHRVDGADAFLTLSTYLRDRLKHCGTKIVCSEGDCGSCSVLVGQPDGNGALSYAPIDSCIRFVFQLDGCHVVTVEGLASNGQINSVQQAMIDCHGSQCGYCTPGFVVAMTGVLEQEQQPTEQRWREELTGNLCRCTGYSPIIEAGLQASASQNQSLNEIYPAAEMLTALDRSDSIHIATGPQRLQVFCPTSVAAAVAILAQHPSAKIVAGATDVGVQFNKGTTKPQLWLDLNRVHELRGVHTEDNTILAGAMATWTDLERVTQATVPQLHEIITIFGSPQIRNVGTIGGNIINASPIADSLPLLFVCEAELELQGSDGTRSVNINEFYHGYKQFDLQAGELLTGIRIPLPADDESLRLYKVSRRRDLDISSFTAAIRMKIVNDTIHDAAIAYGAVAPVVLRLRQTESFLEGKSFTESTMREAGSIAVNEISPISDVRGSADYRFQLARNVLLKFFHEAAAAEVTL